MVEYTLSELFRRDSVDKQIDISFDDVHITNSDFRGQDFELTESLCSESELRFGCCESSVLKFKISNNFGELKDKWLTVRTVLEGNVDRPFQFGKYRVKDDVVSGDRQSRSITAYDAMYDIINAELAEWYNSLKFPISQKDFRDSLFEYLGIPQVGIELIQDSMMIEQTVNTTTLSGKDVVSSLCELNGVFGHINRNGEFTYISLPDRISIYPSIHLFPGNELFPIIGRCGDLYDTESLANGRYISCEYEDFETQYISNLQIRQEKNDIGVVITTENGGTNTYIVEDNFLVYGKSSEELHNIATQLLDKIKYIQYRPTSVELRGNPCLEVGDGVVCTVRNKIISTYILQRTLNGVQALRDSFTSEGVYEYSEQVNSVQRTINQLRGKTNILERTVEETKSTITNVEKNLQSQITQNADGIKTKVSKGDVSSEISQEAGKISIKGDRIAIESKYFKLSEDGSIEATNGYFRGTFEQYNTNGVKSIEIRSNQVMVYAWHDNGNYVGSFGALRQEQSDGSYKGMAAMWCDYGDTLSLNYNSPTDSNLKKTVISFDPVNMESGHTPWIKNTSSGTLFPDNPRGGVIVENGLIKNWSMSGSTSTIFPNNPSGGIVLKNGLVTSWNLKSASGTLFPNNPNGGIQVVNGLITDWSMTRIADSTLSVMTGAWINGEGLVGGFQFADIVIKDGLFISWSYRTVWLKEGWIQ